MARQLVVDMPAMIHGIRRKQRKTKWHPCRVAAPVEIAETTAVDDPQALVTTYERWAKTGPRRKETVRQAVAGHAGALWRPVPGPDHGPRASFEDLAAAARHPYWRGYPFGKQPTGLPTHVEALTTMREVRKDTSEWALAKASRVAADLILVDGTLHRRDIEPVWMVIPGGDRVEIDFQRPFPGRIASGIPVPLLEFDKAERLANDLAQSSGVKVKAPWMKLETARPEFLSATTETTFARMMTMAFVAARNSIRRQCRGMVPDLLNERFEAFTAAMAPGGDVCAAARLLDDVELSASDFAAAEYGDYADPREGDRCRTMQGGWRHCAAAAIGAGVMHDLIGGEDARPELDSEDEDALAALGI